MRVGPGRVGFTGTRNGLTDPQSGTLADLLLWTDVWLLHHGDCIGADEAAYALARSMSMHTIAHPSTLTAQRAYTSKNEYVFAPLPPLERNKEIVKICDQLIACPNGTEVVRSGTWATIREARKQGKRVAICWPSGELTLDPARVESKYAV